ncbi:MAG TPA: MBL fold metallo-hydrolase [Vicinamibacterales bacterium]
MTRLTSSAALSFALAASFFQARQPDGAGVVRGGLPDRWLVSGPECPADPHFQVHDYNADLVILRESGCSNYEKPFIYLIFGRTKVLMLDTGADRTDIAEVVRRIIDERRRRAGREIPLVVAHTHAHRDHISGDTQLQSVSATTVVGLTPEAVRTFFGFRNWPDEIVPFDLGERTVDVIPIPGHEPSSIAVYDRQTGILFTGDTLYPGRLYVRDALAFSQSIQRLVDFTRGKIVAQILGNHIEQTRTPYLDYPIGTTFQPDEHVLELGRAHLLELSDALRGMNGALVRMAMRDFTIWPD